MIYSIQYQAQDLLSGDFRSVRKCMNTDQDRLYCILSTNDLQESEKINIYKSLLELEGEYRTTYNCWREAILKFRVV